MRKELIENIKGLSEEEKIVLIRKQLNGCLSWLRKRNKASEVEFNHKGDRGGRNCKRNQTLNANSYNNARMYDMSVLDLKKMIKIL